MHVAANGSCRVQWCEVECWPGLLLLVSEEIIPGCSDKLGSVR
jgi:hypothetical protein